MPCPAGGIKDCLWHKSTLRRSIKVRALRHREGCAVTVLDNERAASREDPLNDRSDGSDASAPNPSSFEEFVAATEPRLRRALVAAYGPERGRDATAEALAYAWEHWHRLASVKNLAGYLFRVAQSKARQKRSVATFEVPDDPEHLYEPNLMRALQSLSERQRLAVVLVHGFGWTLRDVADLIGAKPTTVHNHLERGLRRLRLALGVPDAN
jgi:RNA polymerase sigma factor (sigma-70 family)